MQQPSACKLTASEAASHACPRRPPWPDPTVDVQFTLTTCVLVCRLANLHFACQYNRTQGPVLRHHPYCSALKHQILTQNQLRKCHPRRIKRSPKRSCSWAVWAPILGLALLAFLTLGEIDDVLITIMNLIGVCL